MNSDDFHALNEHRPDWQAEALCRGCDAAWWYPERGESDRPVNRAARALCASCPVISECANFGMSASEQIGVWGGLTGRQRQQLKRHGIHERGPIGWLFDRATGDVVVFLDSDDHPSPGEARRLLRAAVVDVQERALCADVSADREPGAA